MSGNCACADVIALSFAVMCLVEGSDGDYAVEARLGLLHVKRCLGQEKEYLRR